MEQFNIGAIYSTPVSFLNGRIDEFGIWNRALSATEVTKLYNYSKARYFE
jgi:hypothetical protein